MAKYLELSKVFCTFTLSKERKGGKLGKAQYTVKVEEAE